MWGVLATSNVQTAANDNLANKPYFWLSLFANLVYFLRDFCVF